MQQTEEELEPALIEKPTSDEGNNEGPTCTKSRSPTSPHNINGPTSIPTSNDKEEGGRIQFFKSIESIADYYKLKDLKSKTKQTDHGFEVFEAKTFDIYSLSNSFRTNMNRLAKWIYAFQEIIYRKWDQMISTTSSGKTN